MNESAIEKAAEAMWWSCGTRDSAWEDASIGDQTRYRKLARAAYPHLSVWEEPTEEEKDRVYEAAHRNSAPVGMSRSQVEFALEAFWQIRNLNATPVDPRVEIVETILAEDHHEKFGDSYNQRRAEPPLIPKPTEAEISRAADRYEVMFRAGVPWLSIVNRLLDEFVSGRNVLPVTVDPRERVILGVLYEAGFPEGSRTTLTKRILAAIDDKEKR